MLAALLALGSCGESPEKPGVAGQKAANGAAKPANTAGQQGPNAGGSEGPEGSQPGPKRGRPKTTDKGANKPAVELTAREIQQALLPRVARASETNKAGFDGGAKLLSLDPRLGLAIEPVLDLLGEYRRASPKELERVAAITKDLRAAYYGRLAKLVQAADIRAIGESEAAFYDVLLNRPGIESLLLLPEFWDSLEKVVGGPVWMALPDRQHLRVFRGRIDSVLRHMASDFVKWSRESSEPLGKTMILREGKKLVPGPSFEKLAKKGP